ncbi:hypothetical protein [Streptomyces sp. ICBB 8177]|uniref:hypothetical protein n=1 Tax=Streptomyces sp. ICBB 8177 TaxID=563922 RepID=UPI000D672D46|nr:hypothetical protein [Streptomyces sp. ICBB 8177]PWI42422.1 hypothetical protein CK485_08640 [Streptomyces sp. ICBB 8177]
MPRGRHRHSPPLHRLLPPLTVAGSASVVAVGAWFSPTGDDGVVLRVLVAAAAAAACAGAVLLRQWDRAAGKRVSDLEAARVRDEWHTDERIAELESDVEESRELRHRLERELRAKRAEMGRLRGEHAALLRRYATAESERARALESRRRLAIEAAAAPKAIDMPATVAVGPDAYRRAAEALRDFGRNAARQKADRQEAEAPSGQARDREPAEEPRDHRLVPAAVATAAVLPYAQPKRPAGRPQGGFDFFGVHKTPAADDLADVVGDEAVALSRSAERESDAARDDKDAAVIDLTAHDETEQIDVAVLRAHS